ncbi:MAG TPA: helix-turn-helix transcriptional regulator [Desulfosporosinus sp.]|nr:helix-turn-helix transcriptional regulator [Desulfosporosinus sp.]
MKTKIKELRARYNLTQKQLAKEVGVRRETIGYLEKGDYNPSLKLAAKVARVLNSTMEEIFIFEDSDLT